MITEAMRCPRCGAGVDDDGDGNCAVCARLSSADAQRLKDNVKTHVSDWERGYAKGYERALSQLVELVEFRVPDSLTLEVVLECVEKLRMEILNAS